LLPQVKPAFDGLDVGWRYVPAKPLETHGQGIQTQVGGVWYDLIPLSAGRVGIVIGDVEGRGARAAAIMGQLRAALRAFAQDEKSPADIMRKLDEWCRSRAPADEHGLTVGDPPTSSCIYMIYDAWSRELTFANAVATAAEYAVPGDIDDDMAILVVQSSPSELASIERAFPAEPIMVSEARRLAAETFRTWGMDSGQAELACLLVSEVVTNAVLHASITPSPGRDLDLEMEPLVMPAPAVVPAGAPGQVTSGPVPSGRVAA